MQVQDILGNLKIMLGITDSDMDEKLKLIIEGVKGRLKILLGGQEPPEDMDHIILEVSIVRFNRIGSEGLTSHTVEGEAQSYDSNDFAGYMDEITAYLNTQADARRGKVRFI